MNKVLLYTLAVSFVVPIRADMVLNMQSMDGEFSSQENLEGGCGCSTGSVPRAEGQPDIAGNRKLDATSTSKQWTESLVVSQESFFSKMVYIPGGEGHIGTDKPQIKSDGEHPKRNVTLSPFFIDKYEVSNADFREFTMDTKYVTESEIFGWSFVFEHAIPPHIKENITQAVLNAEWWLPVEGAFWYQPEGPGTDVFATGRENLPVVQVSWNDAVAFCRWRGARLPTEAEWENAARGPAAKGGAAEDPYFPWGKKLQPNKQHRMNVFQGNFPHSNTAEDGFEFLSPVGSFPPQNDYGLHDMIGNAWEWVEDWFTTNHETRHQTDPTGPKIGKERVKKGGSFLCHRSYCYRYRTVARFPSTPDSATLNLGFRCAASAGTVKRSATLQKVKLQSLASFGNDPTDEL